MRLVDRDLGEALGQVFVAKTFSPDTKDAHRAHDHGRSRRPWRTTSSSSPGWATPPKSGRLPKLHGMVNKIGYPDKWRDYSSRPHRPRRFSGQRRARHRFESQRQLAKIGKPVDRTEWQMTPPTVNAYYDPQMNDINFPAGVLQPPLFDPKMDDAPNYGNTGATIGHELTHGFDDEGRQFDAKGNLNDWWTKQDADEFEKRADCVSDQYSQIHRGGRHQDQRQADAGRRRSRPGRHASSPTSPGRTPPRARTCKPIDGFTPDQRFFIGMAQWACGDERPESKRLNAITNPHSPDEYRINGVVSNMPEFAKAFSCKAGQPMVRENACRVW